MLEQLASDKDIPELIIKTIGTTSQRKVNLFSIAAGKTFIWTKHNWNSYLLHNQKHVFLLYTATYPNTI